MNHIMMFSLILILTSCGNEKEVQPISQPSYDYARILLRAGDGEPPDIMNIHDKVRVRLLEITKDKNYKPFSGRAYMLNGKTYVDYSFFVKREKEFSDLISADKVLSDINQNYGSGKTWRPVQMVMKYNDQGNEIDDEFIVLFQTIWK